MLCAMCNGAGVDPLGFGSLSLPQLHGSQVITCLRVCLQLLLWCNLQADRREGLVLYVCRADDVLARLLVGLAACMLWRALLLLTACSAYNTHANFDGYCSLSSCWVGIGWMSGLGGDMTHST